MVVIPYFFFPNIYDDDYYEDHIPDTVREVKNNPDGYCCTRCNTLNNYAVPNQKDGTYICYSCRS